MKYLIAAVLLFAVAFPLARSFATVDNFPFAHGLSVGTDTHYCSVEFDAGFSCEVSN